jgi:hypothetical protein
MLWITTRSHAFSPGVAKTGGALVAVANLSFCQGKWYLDTAPRRMGMGLSELHVTRGSSSKVIYGV